ncbi:MAG: hypothetical protein AAF738_08090 [Bacteroidota bacterium]
MRTALLCFIAYLSVAFTLSTEVKETLIMPRVFVLGEYEEEYYLLQQTYATTLLEVCDDDMQLAFGKLTTMYEEMEVYAEQIGYDINGVRLWIHVFWDETGVIEYLGFHLRPNSRKVEHEDV